MKTISEFENLINQLLKEAPEPPKPPQDDEEENIEDVEIDVNELGDEDVMDNEDVLDEPVSLEEIELAKLAVRAINFDLTGKDIDKLFIKYNDRIIPLKKIPDFFEETKNTKVVIGFVEWIIDKFEGFHSKWSEDPSFKGKNIIQKIEAINAVAKPEEKLDNSKRVLWARIILNGLIRGAPDDNMTISEINPVNIKDVFNKLNMDFGGSTQGILSTNDITKGPGNF